MVTAISQNNAAGHSNVSFSRRRNIEGASVLVRFQPNRSIEQVNHSGSGKAKKLNDPNTRRRPPTGVHVQVSELRPTSSDARPTESSRGL